LDTVRQKLAHLAENEQTLARHIEQIRSLPVFNPQDLTSLQAEISACGEQLTTAMSTVSSLATLKNTAQELDSDVATLRKVLQRQEAELLSLREALSAKDTRIDALQSTMQEMYTALKNFQSQQPSMAGLRDELQTYIRQQVPAAAAHIIREEIAELLQEMGEE
ncbi:MAG: hypothetical protein GX055_12215, partial [Desulfovibrionales bacterium]|nr:hypothetical protein [Desulfovibrionales bacterium]